MIASAWTPESEKVANARTSPNLRNEKQASSNKVYQWRGYSKCGFQLGALYCEKGEEENWGMGLATGKMFNATPSRAPEKPLLEHRIKIGVVIGLFPFAVA